MAHWTQHKSVWFPGRATVCGRRLPILTLGHWRLLEIIETPFLGDGTAQVGKADLALAVALVRLPWRVARVVLGHAFLRRLAASWAVWRVSDWQAEAGAFAAYLDDCLWAPEAYREDGARDINAFGCASSAAMRIAWRLGGGQVPTRNHPVWSLSVVEALAWAVTAAELSNRGFVTRDEVEMVERQVAQQVAEEAKKAGVQ